MDISTINVPPGGYAAGRIIYAFRFADGCAYVGITGSSNATGVSRPLARLATHLRKSGNTYSILVTHQDLANRGFKFSYSTLPADVAPLAEAVEQQCREILRKDTVRLLNGRETHVVSIPSERQQAVLSLAHAFAEHVRSLSL